VAFDNSISRKQSFQARAIIVAAILSAGWFGPVLAQEPPSQVPNSEPTKPPDAMSVGDWLIYPSVRLFSLYSDNLFQSPTAPISAVGLGVAPSMTAEWSNGIHKTTLYGNLERRQFPSEKGIDTFDYQSGFAQRYEMFRDLVFRAQADVTHKTIAPSLVSGIPNPIVSPATIVLPNGNTQLPNGTILSPSGQPIGQAPPGLTVNGTSIVNPYTTFTGTVGIDKYFNDGVINLNSSFARADYDKLNPDSTSQDFATRTFSGNGAFWLGPVFYVYSNGAVSELSRVTGDTTTFRTIGGVGVHLNPLFGGSIYYGRHGSEANGGASGGDNFGLSLSYNPMLDLAFKLTADETTNIASRGFVSPVALPLTVPTPLQIPTSSSTRIMSITFSSDYTISERWTTAARLGYTHVNFIDSPQVTQSWYADATLAYSMSKNLTLSWEYQFTSITSNVPNSNSTRNFILINALYKF